MVTIKHLLKPPVTVEYPEQTRDIPARARTNLLWFEERCTGCSTCAQSCPDGCILVETSQSPDGTRSIDRYEIDFRVCMYCGLCTEACPYQAIQPGGRLDDAVYDFSQMYKNKHALNRLAQEYLETHDHVYPNGGNAPTREEVETGFPARRNP